MRITLKDFKAHVGERELHKVGLHAIPRVHTITTKFYCDVLTQRSACSEQCAECILTLKKRLDTNHWEGSRPYALFTFTVKNTAAQMMEVRQSKPAPIVPPVLFKKDEEKDVLDTLLETLND
jgi:hypothetical protein